MHVEELYLAKHIILLWAVSVLLAPQFIVVQVAIEKSKWKLIYGKLHITTHNVCNIENIANTDQEITFIDNLFRGNITQVKALIWIQHVFGESENKRKRPMVEHATTVLKKEQNCRQLRQITAFCYHVLLINQHWLQKENDINRL